MAGPTLLGVPIILLLLLHITPVSKSLPSKTCSDYQKASQPTFCFRLQGHSEKTDEYVILNAIGSLKLKNAIFPIYNNHWVALISFDEPLYPIPLGASVYFCLCIALLFSYFMTKFIRTFFNSTRKKLLLHPQTAKLPHLPLYWLQQSAREQSLKREVRNTWAWLAKKFMLSPADPLLSGIDETLSNTTWEDFHLPKDTWSLINNVLAVNDLFVDVHSHVADGKKRDVLQIKKGTNDPTQGPLSRLPAHLLPIDMREGEDDEEEVLTADGIWKLKKRRKSISTTSGKLKADDVPGKGQGDTSTEPPPDSDVEQVFKNETKKDSSSSDEKDKAMTKQDWKEDFRKRRQSRLSIAPIPKSLLRHRHETKHIRHHRKLRQGSESKKKQSQFQSHDLGSLPMDHLAYLEVLGAPVGAGGAKFRKSHPDNTHKKSHPEHGHNVHKKPHPEDTGRVSQKKSHPEDGHNLHKKPHPESGHNLHKKSHPEEGGRVSQKKSHPEDGHPKRKSPESVRGSKRKSPEGKNLKQLGKKESEMDKPGAGNAQSPKKMVSAASKNKKMITKKQPGPLDSSQDPQQAITTDTSAPQSGKTTPGKTIPGNQKIMPKTGLQKEPLKSTGAKTKPQKSASPGKDTLDPTNKGATTDATSASPADKNTLNKNPGKPLTGKTPPKKQVTPTPGKETHTSTTPGIVDPEKKGGGALKPATPRANPQENTTPPNKQGLVTPKNNLPPTGTTLAGQQNQDTNKKGPIKPTIPTATGKNTPPPPKTETRPPPPMYSLVPPPPPKKRAKTPESGAGTGSNKPDANPGQSNSAPEMRDDISRYSLESRPSNPKHHYHHHHGDPHRHGIPHHRRRRSEHGKHLERLPSIDPDSFQQIPPIDQAPEKEQDKKKPGNQKEK